MDNRTMINGGAPPPPSEVKVRTMHSDLTSMTQSGGGLPRFENVAVSGLSIEKETPAPIAVNRPPASSVQPPVQSAVTVQSSTTTLPAEPVLQSAAASKKNLYPILIVAVVAILAILGVGYVAYTSFFSGSQNVLTASSTTTQNVSLPPVATTSNTSGAGTSGANAATNFPVQSAELSSAHISLFTKPADQVLPIDLGAVTPNTYRKTMTTALSAASAASTMIEIRATANDKNALSAQGLFTVSGAQMLPAQVLADFNPDATFFVYRDRNGLWPGYVLTLNANVTTSSAASAAQALELSPSIANIFLADPGTPSSDGFTDSTLAGVPVRVLPFAGLSMPSYFTYGWYGNDLILSASQNGFAAAVAYISNN